MSSEVFRGKESSNRIELSRLVQNLLNFGVLGSLWLWGGGRWVGVSGDMGGVPPTHIHAHAHTCTHTHVYMYRNCKWLPTWRHPCLACLTCMCVCVCVYMHVCMHAWDTPSCTHTHPHLHPSICHPLGGWTPRISKNSITLELIKIFQFCLKI